MTLVVNLQPGDVVSVFGPDGPIAATYVAQTRHPLWPRLQLVVWRMADGGWSHEALSPAQDVGDVQPSTVAHRTQRLRAALFGASR
jgi:hypothetical protein